MFLGKHRSVVVTAIAREMVTFIWAITREVGIQPIDPRQRIARLPA